VGTFPFGIAVNPVLPRVYVTNVDTNNVSVIDTDTNTVKATVTVGANPYGIAVNPSGTKAYVANGSGSSVSVIDTATNTVAATISVGLNPYGLAVSPTGKRLYVTHDVAAGIVTAINTVTNSVEATVSVGSIPQGVSFNPAGTRAYTVNLNSSTLSVINTETNTVTSTVSLVGLHPTGFGNFIGPYLGDIQLLGIDANLEGVAKTDQAITFTALATGKGPIYYKFWYRAGYGSTAYASNPWEVMQDFSPSNTCSHTFTTPSNYIVVVWAVKDPADSYYDIIGFNVKVEN
jgi:YVTN family beta-propeller protein